MSAATPLVRAPRLSCGSVASARSTCYRAGWHGGSSGASCRNKPSNNWSGHMRTRTQWVGAAALAASVSVIPTADAVIGSSPGLDCVSDEIVTNQLLQYGGQMAFNTSTTVAIGVWCPVPRRAPDNLAI